jgi:hypothetical protein
MGLSSVDLASLHGLSRSLIGVITPRRALAAVMITGSRLSLCWSPYVSIGPKARVPAIGDGREERALRAAQDANEPAVGRRVAKYDHVPVAIYGLYQPPWRITPVLAIFSTRRRVASGRSGHRRHISASASSGASRLLAAGVFPE